MKLFKHPVLLETACGHDGDEKILKKLTDIAIKSKGKQIKYQIFNLEERSLVNTKEHKIFKPLCLSQKIWKKIIIYAKKNKLFTFADVYGDYSFRLANSNNIDGYKIHSEDFFNSFFIEKVINTKKPVIINLGGTYKSEVYNLISFLNKKKKLNKKIVLMHGVQTFPTPIEGHSLYEFRSLIENYKKFDVSFGYSDHIDGENKLASLLPISAYCMGADLIEKHITDKRIIRRTDFHSALEPKEINELIQNIDFIGKTLKKENRMNIYEKKYRNMFKKSPAIKKFKIKNGAINEKDIIFLKNPKKHSFMFSHNLNGTKINRNINTGTIITPNKLKKRIGAIIIARMSSNRFKGKVLKKINGEHALSLVIRRVKKIKNLNEIILATSTNKEDIILKKIAKKENIKFYRGSLDNVASRYYNCAKKFKLDHFVRVTGDAILCDDQMLNKAIISHINKQADVTFIKNMPYGTAKEVVSLQTIKTIMQTAKYPKNTEYLEFFMENHKNFKVNYIKSKYKFDKNIRLTLDFKEDLILFDKIFKFFKDKNCKFNLNDVLYLLKKKPKLVKINSFLKPKFLPKEINTELKI